MIIYYLSIYHQVQFLFSSVFEDTLIYCVVDLEDKEEMRQPFSGTRSCSNEDLADYSWETWNLVSNSFSYIVYPVVVNMWSLWGFVY